MNREEGRWHSSDPATRRGASELGRSGLGKLFVCGANGQQKTDRVDDVEVAVGPGTGREKIFIGGERRRVGKTRGLDWSHTGKQRARRREPRGACGRRAMGGAWRSGAD